MKTLKKIDNKPGYFILGVSNVFISKLTDYFFAIIDEETPSLGHVTLFTGIKVKFYTDKHFGPMYIDFDYHYFYIGAIYENFKTIDNAHIQCDNGYPYSKIKDNMLTYINEDS